MLCYWLNTFGWWAVAVSGPLVWNSFRTISKHLITALTVSGICWRRFCLHDIRTFSTLGAYCNDVLEKFTFTIMSCFWLSSSWINNSQWCCMILFCCAAEMLQNTFTGASVLWRCWLGGRNGIRLVKNGRIVEVVTASSGWSGTESDDQCVCLC